MVDPDTVSPPLLKDVCPLNKSDPDKDCPERSCYAPICTENEVNKHAGESTKRRVNSHTKVDPSKHPFDYLAHIIVYGDASLSVIITACAMWLWLLFGAVVYPTDLDAHSAQYPAVISYWFWIWAYAATPFMKLLCVIKRFPPFLSLMTGSWMIIVWGFSFFSRAFSTTGQTGLATSMTMMVIGILIIHRSALRA